MLLRDVLLDLKLSEVMRPIKGKKKSITAISKLYGKYVEKLFQIENLLLSLNVTLLKSSNLFPREYTTAPIKFSIKANDIGIVNIGSKTNK